jgi:50S ribosomal protein L16 3-hydroxylase
MTEQPRIIGSFPLDLFLREYFQRQALFVPGALPGFESPLDAESLAGLALEEGVESRLVERTRLPRPGDNGPPWELREGPYTEKDFENLAEREWTLLVQDVDKFVPEIHALLELVSFLPRWSVDDIMVSYAAPGGSVGPHTDRYDVFLLQAQGTRRWELARDVDNSRLRSDTTLKVLESFTPEETYLARPGDVLYLPAGVAHFGVAEEDCLTFSFGFRAPSEERILGALLEDYSAERGEVLLKNAVASSVVHPAQLNPELLSQLDSLLERFLREAKGRTGALGRLFSEPKEHLAPEIPETLLSGLDLKDELEAGAELQRGINSRFLFAIQEGPKVTLFVNGQEHALEGTPEAERFCVLLCEGPPVGKAELMPWSKLPGGPEVWSLLAALHNEGALILA